MENNEKEFIKELEALSRKYKLQVWGCGCCGSPFIVEIKDSELSEESGYSYENHLKWIYPEDFYWKDCGERPVK